MSSRPEIFKNEIMKNLKVGQKVEVNFGRWYDGIVESIELVNGKIQASVRTSGFKRTFSLIDIR